MHPIKSIVVRNRRRIANNFGSSKYGKILKEFKNIHKGESCFIIGNGPSLRIEDLEAIAKKGIPTFATNRIYNLFDNSDWRPTYYACEDEIIADDAGINIYSGFVKFIPIELKWDYDINVHDAIYFHRQYRSKKIYKHGFSPDISVGIASRGTVTYTCMQIAVYMGFEMIYLLGVDHNYKKIIDDNGNVVVDNTVDDYFCSDYDADVIDQVVHDMGNNTRAYISARDYCIENKCAQIFNATRGGKLELFPRVDLDVLLEEL